MTSPDIGAQATLIRIDHIGEDSEVWTEYVIVQRDQYVFFVSADEAVFGNMPGSDDVDNSLPTVELAAEIATRGEPSSDDPTFSKDGISIGGLWSLCLQPMIRG